MIPCFIFEMQTLRCGDKGAEDKGTGRLGGCVEVVARVDAEVEFGDVIDGLGWGEGAARVERWVLYLKS
jgi:hypothetical protein